MQRAKRNRSGTLTARVALEALMGAMTSGTRAAHYV
jgi:hypothetical protein